MEKYGKRKHRKRKYRVETDIKKGYTGKRNMEKGNIYIEKEYAGKGNMGKRNIETRHIRKGDTQEREIQKEEI